MRSAILLAAFALSFNAQAAIPNYKGDMTLLPHSMHSSPITGQMTVTYVNDQVTAVGMVLDKAVFGMATASSKEHWSMSSTDGTTLNRPVVYLLNGPSHHGWYFVYRGSSTDGGNTLQGPVYRANGKMKDIQKALQTVPFVLPATWVEIGSSVLKAQN